MADRKVTISLFGDDRDLDQKIADAKRKLDDLRTKSKSVPIGIDKTKFDQEIRAAEIKLDELNHKKAKPNIDTTKASLELDKLDLKMDRTKLKMDTLAAKGVSEVGTSFTELGSDIGAFSNYVIPGLIAGLVGISGQLVTVGFGLAGFGAAAFKDIDPIIKLSQKAGGLAGNLSSLDPVQRKLALGLLGLGQDYDKFAASLKPEVFSAFNQGLSLADNLMHDVQPVAAATGKAFSFVLGQIDKEFQSGTWQKFFSFMAKEAGPDVRQIGQVFTDLLQAIPPLAEALHPLGTVLINDLDDITKFLGGLGQLQVGIEGAVNKINNTMDSLSNAAHKGTHFNLLDAAKNALHEIAPELPMGQAIVGWVEKLGKGSDTAASGQDHLASAAQRAAAAAMNEQKSMDTLSGAIQAVTNKTLALQDADISWHQAMNDATKAINANHNALDGNTDSALAAKSAILQSTNAALKNAESQLTMSHNAAAASRTILTQIGYLEQHAGRSKFAAQEVMALMQAEARLPKNVQSKITVNTTTAEYAIAGIERRLSLLNGKVVTTYVTTQYVAPGGSAQGNINRGGYASGTSGAAPGWAWVGEKGPELVKMKGGEVVIPNHRSMSMASVGPVPGFAHGIGFDPIISLPYVGTKTPPAGVNPGGQIHLVISGQGDELVKAIVKSLRYEIRANGGGNVQGHLGWGSA